MVLVFGLVLASGSGSAWATACPPLGGSPNVQIKVDVRVEPIVSFDTAPPRLIALATGDIDIRVLHCPQGASTFRIGEVWLNERDGSRTILAQPTEAVQRLKLAIPTAKLGQRLKIGVLYRDQDEIPFIQIVEALVTVQD